MAAEVSAAAEAGKPPGGSDSCGEVGVESPGGAPPPRVGVGMVRVRGVGEGVPWRMNHRLLGWPFWQRRAQVGGVSPRGGCVRGPRERAFQEQCRACLGASSPGRIPHSGAGVERAGAEASGSELCSGTEGKNKEGFLSTGIPHSGDPHFRGRRR